MPSKVAAQMYTVRDHTETRKDSGRIAPKDQQHWLRGGAVLRR